MNIELLPEGIRQVELYQRLKEILEDIFSPEWFLHAGRAPSAVYERWAFCQQMIAQNGIFQFAPNQAEIVELSKFLYDVFVFTVLTGGDMEHLQLGTLDRIGDEAVLKRIRGTASHPEQYEDMMVELYIAAWYRAKGCQAHLTQQPGWPDIRVDSPDLRRPLLIDCKRVQSPAGIAGSGRAKRIKGRIEEKIRDANNQIKRASQEQGVECYGAVVLDATALFTLEEIKNSKLLSGKRMKNVVREAVLSVLSMGCTAVNYVVVVWSGYKWEGEAPGFAHCQFNYYRECFEHKRAILFEPHLTSYLYAGHGIDATIGWHQNPGLQTLPEREAQIVFNPKGGMAPQI